MLEVCNYDIIYVNSWTPSVVYICNTCLQEESEMEKGTKCQSNEYVICFDEHIVANACSA